MKAGKVVFHFVPFTCVHLVKHLPFHSHGMGMLFDVIVVPNSQVPLLLSY